MTRSRPHHLSHACHRNHKPKSKPKPKPKPNRDRHRCPGCGPLLGRGTRIRCRCRLLPLCPRPWSQTSTRVTRKSTPCCRLVRLAWRQQPLLSGRRRLHRDPCPCRNQPCRRRLPSRKGWPWPCPADHHWGYYQACRLFLQPRWQRRRLSLGCLEAWDRYLCRWPSQVSDRDLGCCGPLRHRLRRARQLSCR